MNRCLTIAAFSIAAMGSVNAVSSPGTGLHHNVSIIDLIDRGKESTPLTLEMNVSSRESPILVTLDKGQAYLQRLDWESSKRSAKATFTLSDFTSGWQWQKDNLKLDGYRHLPARKASSVLVAYGSKASPVWAELPGAPLSDTGKLVIRHVNLFGQQTGTGDVSWQINYQCEKPRITSGKAISKSGVLTSHAQHFECKRGTLRRISLKPLGGEASSQSEVSFPLNDEKLEKLYTGHYLMLIYPDSQQPKGVNYAIVDLDKPVKPYGE
ncbi:hypothetical protein [Veronia pacifica]|uniref:Uncharacterized protein n=1 Tax=Veronia pacifica TaxID=1080227 RepID=A0A1C3ESS9_9GAMM|nr:hypothetical protein [Veronia pacifica]ODA36203.1 hypothetical protein A8L45_00955 [Veronia pacifica]